jgi:hypothetical protein
MIRSCWFGSGVNLVVHEASFEVVSSGKFQADAATRKIEEAFSLEL